MDGNATRAAVASGYSRRTARTIGSRLTKVDIVATAIAAGQRQAQQLTEVTRDTIVAALATIGFAPVREIRACDARAALVDLAKLLGFWRESVDVETPTLEEIVAGANSPEMHELSRLERSSPEAIRAECEAKHSGRCRTLREHADRCAEAQAGHHAAAGGR